MNTIINELKNNFRRGSICIQFIYINAGVFIITTLVSVILLLFNIDITGLFHWLELPAWPQRFLIQPWSLFTYMFLHNYRDMTDNQTSAHMAHNQGRAFLPTLLALRTIFRIQDIQTISSTPIILLCLNYITTSMFVNIN